MATTTSKKEILDYLWEWAEHHGSWAKLLAKKVIELEDSLPEEELAVVYDEFLKNIVPSADNSPIEIERPGLAVEPSDLILSSMSEIQGVNKLATSQTLDFSNNITIIYGANATGKSGYSRILRALGLSYEKVTEVHGNIYDKSQTPQSAKLEYVLNRIPCTFVWDGTLQSTHLRSLSIFTNDCVNITLDRKRDLLVTPIGFHLFRIASSDLDRLSKIHEAKIKEYEPEIAWIERLHERTEVHTFLTNLSAKSSRNDFDGLKIFTEDDAKRINDLNERKKGLNKKLLETQISNLSQQAGELSTVQSKVEAIQRNFKSEDWTIISDHLKKMDQLKNQEQTSLTEIAQERGIALYETQEFMEFIKAADRYIKKLGKEDYPRDEDDTCVYCKQRLAAKDARDLLTSYRLFLNNTTQAAISEHERSLKLLRTKIDNLHSDIKLHHASFGETEKKEPIQPPFLEQFCKQIDAFKRLAGTGRWQAMQTKTFDIEYEKVIAALDEKDKAIRELLGGCRFSLYMCDWMGYEAVA